MKLVWIKKEIIGYISIINFIVYLSCKLSFSLSVCVKEKK